MPMIVWVKDSCLILKESLMFRSVCLSTLFVATFSLVARAEDGPLQYPATKRIDHVDIYHGTNVPDPYRWLEEDVRESDEVAGWVEAENKVTFAYLKSIAERELIKKRITELWNYEKVSAPHRAGPRYYFSKNDGLQNQAVEYIQDNLQAKPHVLIGPNQWS